MNKENFQNFQGTVQKSVEQKPKRTKKKNTECIWLYGAHPLVTNRTIFRLLYPYSDDHDRLRIKLGIPLDKPFLPIFPNTQNKLQTIQNLLDKDLKNIILIVVGQEGDKEDEKIQDLYQGRAIFTHPQERKFLIDTMADPMSYQVANQEKEKWLDYLGNFFDSVEVVQ